jgi:hypothetical protein
MTATTRYDIRPEDRAILRRLAAQKKALAESPVNGERREAWLAAHGLRPRRPLILAEHGGIMDPKRPFAPTLECREEWARGVESGLRYEIWRHEWLKDDHVVEPWIATNWRVSIGNYGVQPVMHKADNAGHLGARRWDPPIRDLDADFGKLHARSIAVDREGTLAFKAVLDDVFDGVAPVVLRGGFWWTLGMTITAIDLIGLEPLMLYMYDNPAGLHRLMALLRDDHLQIARWLEQEGLLSLNNANDYIGSGSEGYVPDLPAPGYAADRPARLKDQWVLIESQETVGVGPELFEEFIFPYQKAIADHFGLVYYGCCEPVHTRWHVLEKLTNLRAVSVSPWCDEEFMAAHLGQRRVYSRKPNPTLISTERFDETAIREDLRKTLRAARKHGCPTEIVMKDVHTLHNEPERLARWVQLAREECA